MCSAADKPGRRVGSIMGDETAVGELRQDPVTRNWVVVAPGRAHRPGATARADLDLPTEDELLSCPFDEAGRVDPESLARVKTKTRATLIRQLDSNAGLAQLLTSYYVNYGDWRKLFTSIDDINKVTAGDVQRVAQKYFVTNARTTAFDFQPAPNGAQPAPAADPAGEKQ